MTTAETQSATTDAEAADNEPREQPHPEPQLSNSEKLEQWAFHNITLIRWGVTVNLGNYESARIDCEAVLTSEHNPAETLDLLKEWVTEHSPATTDQWNTLNREKRAMQLEVKQLEVQLDKLRQEWESVKRFAEKHSLALPQSVIEDLPF